MTIIEASNNTKLNENELLKFEGYKAHFYAHENNHLKHDSTFLNIWYYDMKRGGIRPEKTRLHTSKNKGLYYIKFGKRQYLNDLRQSIVKSYFPNRAN